MVCQPPTSTLVPYTTLFRSFTPASQDFATINANLSFGAFFMSCSALVATPITVGQTINGMLTASSCHSPFVRAEVYTSELQSHHEVVCRLLLETTTAALMPA